MNLFTYKNIDEIDVKPRRAALPARKHLCEGHFDRHAGCVTLSAAGSARRGAVLRPVPSLVALCLSAMSSGASAAESPFAGNTLRALFTVTSTACSSEGACRLYE